MLNYHLLPQASIDDVLAEIEDQPPPQTVLSTQTSAIVLADTNRILATGDSAGGYISLMLCLAHPTAIRALTAENPLTDAAGPWFSQPIFRLPYLLVMVIAKHREQVAKGELPLVVSADPRRDNRKQMLACAENGMKREFFVVSVEGKRRLFPRELGSSFRVVVFLCVMDDSVVPVQASIEFNELIEKVNPELKYDLAIEREIMGLWGVRSWITNGCGRIEWSCRGVIGLASERGP
ncbi:putative alpha beta hydrolase fold-3 protein [Lasiodiplodia theobromae]|nr:putative alpha beta hydrolase fold-3 protein [Lasiodiplodia theobromae]